MAVRYLTALKAGQLVLAKESGDSYRAWDAEFSVNGLDASACPDGSGLIAPIKAGAPGTDTNTEGTLLWDSAGDNLYVGMGGTSWKQISSSVVLPNSTAASSILIGNGSGGWAEQKLTLFDSNGDITHPSTGAADDFTIALTGAVDSSMILSSTGTGADALQIRTSAGGMVVDANNAMTLDAGGVLELNSDGGAISIGNDANAYALNLGTAGARTITMGNATGATAVDIKSGSGGINLHDGVGQLDMNGAGALSTTGVTTVDLDCSSTLQINSSGGAISIGNDANAYGINIGTGAAARTVTIGNSTGASSTVIDVGTGNLDLGVTATAHEVRIGSATGVSGITMNTGTGGIDIGANAIAATITIGNATGATGVDIKSGTNGINLNDGIAQLDLDGAGALTETALVSANITPSGALTLRGDGISQFGDDVGYFNFDGNGALSTSGVTTVDLDCSGALQINSSAGAISIGNDAINQNINIGTGGTRTITVGTTAATLDFNAGAGGITMDATSGIISLAGTAGSSVDLARTGIMTNINGTLLVDEQADFTANVDANLGLDVSGGNLTLDSNDLIINTNKFTVDGATGDTYISGNLTVAGTITGIQTIDMIVRDNYMQENVGYTTAVAVTGGLVTNYLPTATATTTNGAFVAGVASTSNPYVTTTGSATFTVGDIIQISGSTNNINDGFFEVLTHVGTKLEVRGIGVTATVEPWSRNQFTAQAAPSPAASITKVTVSIMRSGTDGIWEMGAGAVTGITYSNLITSGTLTLQAAYEGGNTITTSGGEGNLTFAGTEDLIVTLDNINLDPTGTFDMAMDAAGTITFHMADAQADAFSIVEAANNYLNFTTSTGAETITIGDTDVTDLVTTVYGGAIATMATLDGSFTASAGDGLYIDGTSTLALTIQNVIDFVYTGVDITFTPSGATLLDGTGGTGITIYTVDNNPLAFVIGTGDELPNIMTIDTTDSAEQVLFETYPVNFLTTVSVGTAGNPYLNFSTDGKIEIQSAATTSRGLYMYYGTVAAPGAYFRNMYGDHLRCTVPTGKSTTIAQGVAFITAGGFNVSGSAADVDQVTVQEMVRGVAQETITGSGTAIWVQVSGVAEVEVDQTGSPAVDEGALMKWSLNGKVCLNTRDLSASAPFYEELAGVVVYAADRSGAAYAAGSQNKVQMLLMNPAAGTYIPA